MHVFDQDQLVDLTTYPWQPLWMLPLFKVTSPTVTIAWVPSGLESEEVIPRMIHRNDGHHNPVVITIQWSSQSSGHHNSVVITIQRSSQSSGHHNPVVIAIQWSSQFSSHHNPSVITIHRSSQSSGHHSPVSTQQEALPGPIKVAVHAQHSQQHELAHDASSCQHCKTPLSTQSSK